MQVTINALSAAFNTILNEWLTPKQLTRVNQRNLTDKYKDACATHDFCDPNEAMLQAFNKLFEREFVFYNEDIKGKEKQSELDNADFNAAWQISKKNQFKI